MRRRRVVVTGMGSVCAAGAGVEAFWSACVEGRPALRPHPRFRLGATETPPVGLCSGVLRGEEEGAAELVLAASLEAVREARLEAGGLSSSGIVLGTCLGGALDLFRWLDERRGGDDAAHVACPESGGLASPALRLAAEYGVTGPVVSISSACSSGIGAIAEATASIRRGEVDRMLAGGVDVLSPFVLAGFRILGALTMTEVRPFDRRRDGLALGEGSAVLVLEERSGALARGAPILAEILGSGTAADGRPGTVPAPAADGLMRAMTTAFRQAGRHPDSVGFVSAQGTGTPHGDRVEMLAIRSVFGDHGIRAVVNSTKPIIGHTLGAAGALSTIVCVKVMQHGLMPPTLNHEEPEVGCDSDCVGKVARREPVHSALALSSGFASHNAALLLGRP